VKIVPRVWAFDDHDKEIATIIKVPIADWRFKCVGILFDPLLQIDWRLNTGHTNQRMLSKGSVNRIRIENLNLPILSAMHLATFLVFISGCLLLITNLAAAVEGFSNDCRTGHVMNGAFQPTRVIRSGQVFI
jgi:hypothetical protein